MGPLEDYIYRQHYTAAYNQPLHRYKPFNALWQKVLRFADFWLLQEDIPRRQCPAGPSPCRVKSFSNQGVWHVNT